MTVINQAVCSTNRYPACASRSCTIGGRMDNLAIREAKLRCEISGIEGIVAKSDYAGSCRINSLEGEPGYSNNTSRIRRTMETSVKNYRVVCGSASSDCGRVNSSANHLNRFVYAIDAGCPCSRTGMKHNRVAVD